MLASDDDRERTVIALRDATVEGRLTLDEFSDRVGGTIDLDLGSATLAGQDTTINVRNYFGTITILVPRGVEVSVDGGGPPGTRELGLPDAGPVPDAPRLRIHTSGVGGTLRIRQAREP